MNLVIFFSLTMAALSPGFGAASPPRLATAFDPDSCRSSLGLTVTPRRAAGSRGVVAYASTDDDETFCSNASGSEAGSSEGGGGDEDAAASEDAGCALARLLGRGDWSARRDLAVARDLVSRWTAPAPARATRLLRACCGRSELGAVAALLLHGVETDPRATDGNGRSLLHVAAFGDNAARSGDRRTIPGGEDRNAVAP